MARSLKLTRDQIAQIVGNDPRAIRQFELLEDETTALEDVTNLATNASSDAQAAIAAINRLSSALEAIAYAPRVEPRESLAMLHDVSIGGLSTNDLLAFDGSKFANVTAIVSGITDTTTNLIASNTTLTDGAGGSAGTLSNAPSAGNPTKWVPIDDNGTTRYIPAW